MQNHDEHMHFEDDPWATEIAMHKGEPLHADHNANGYNRTRGVIGLVRECSHRLAEYTFDAMTLELHKDDPDALPVPPQLYELIERESGIVLRMLKELGTNYISAVTFMEIQHEIVDISYLSEQLQETMATVERNAAEGKEPNIATSLVDDVEHHLGLGLDQQLSD